MENQVEDVAAIEEEPIDTGMGEKQRKSGISPVAKIALILGLGGSAIGVAMYMSSSQMADQMRVVAPPQMDATPGGATQEASPEYREFLRAENERRAALAHELGVTSIPTPEVTLQQRQRVEEVEEIPEVARLQVPAEPTRVAQPTTRRILPSPQPQPEQVRSNAQPEQEQVTQVNATRTQPQGGSEEEEGNPFTTNMVRQMGAITPRLSAQGMANADMSNSSAVNGGGNQSAGTPGGSAGSDETEQGFIIMRPGDILYGEMLVTVDSDNRSPALVEIVTGEFKGARLVGEFTADRRSEALVVNFTSITLPDGRTAAIDAYAVDGRSAQTAVASDVERRYIRRYAPILGATFLAGYADAMSQPEQVIVGTGTERETIASSRTARQSLFAGLAEATNVISRDILQGVPVGPRIILRSGYPVAILIIEPVSVPTAQQEVSTPASTLFNVGGR